MDATRNVKRPIGRMLSRSSAGTWRSGLGFALLRILLTAMRGTLLVLLPSVLCSSPAKAESFTQDLALGSQGAEVSFLQELLRQDPAVYPEGAMNGVYDSGTMMAVKRFQARQGLADDGTVAAATRDYLNALIDERTNAEFNAAALAQIQGYSKAYSRNEQSRAALSLEQVLLERKAEMERMLRINPKHASDLRLSKADRKRCPKELRPLIEEETKARGTVVRYVYDFPDMGYSSGRTYVEKLGRERVEIFSDDDRLLPGARVTLRGIRLGTMFVPGNGLKDFHVVAAVPQAFRSVESIAVLLLAFPDLPPSQFTRDQIIQKISSVTPYYEEASYGTMTVQFQVSGWHTSTQSAASFACDFAAMQREAIAQADPEVNFQTVTSIMLVVANAAGCSVFAFGSLGKNAVFETADGTIVAGGIVATDIAASAITHEFGHNLGLGHAARLECGFDSIRPKPFGTGGCSNNEYGDRLDVMGSGTGQFNASHKTALGFLRSTGAPEQVVTVQNPGNYSIDTYETAITGVKAIRIPRGGNSHIWLEYRREIGFDEDPLGFDDEMFDDTPGASPVLDGAIVHVTLPPIPHSFADSHVIDGTPHNNEGFDFAFVPYAVGQTFYDPQPTSNYAITPTAQIGSTLNLRIDQFPPLLCVTSQRVVAVGSPVTFSAQGGIPPYVWSSPGGNPASGSGTSYTTTYSQPGTFAVTVGLVDHALTGQCTVTTAAAPMGEVTVNGIAGMTTATYSAPLELRWSSVNSTRCELRGFGLGNNLPPSGSHIFPFGYSGPLNGSTGRWGLQCRNGALQDPNTIYSELAPVFIATMEPFVPPTPSGNNAECIELVAPSQVDLGATFTARLVLKNTGTKPWMTDSTPHRLGARNFDFYPPLEPTQWVTTRVGLPGPVNPGETATFEFTARANVTPRFYPYYKFDWQMIEDGVEWFGQGCDWAIWIPDAQS